MGHLTNVSPPKRQLVEDAPDVWLYLVDGGSITHINQTSNITITADEQTADKLQAAADQAGAQINIRPL